jgi:hypothetical protein
MHTTRDVKTRQGFVLPEGSGIYVERVNTRSVYGLWCSMEGSFYVTVPADAVQNKGGE